MSAYRDTIMRLIRQRMGDEPTQAWMSAYRVTVTMRSVTKSGATSIADEIWEKYAEDLDAAQGDFDMTVSRVEGPKSFPVDWTPKASDGAR
jgi:hypothetical protein